MNITVLVLLGIVGIGFLAMAAFVALAAAWFIVGQNRTVK